jgi:PAS domain S-box-containing protein
MQHPQKSQKLRVSIIAPILILITLVALSIGALIKHYLTQHMLADIQSRAELLTHTIVYLVDAGDDPEEFNHMLLALGSEEGVNTLYVVSRDDEKIIASSKPSWKNDSVDTIDEIKHHKSIHAQLSSDDDSPITLVNSSNHSLTYATRLILNKNGEQEVKAATKAIFVELDTQRATEQISQQLRTLLIIVIAALITTVILISKLLNIYIFTPLHFILKAITERSKGNIDAPATVFREDEIGVLAHTFNNLIQLDERKKRIVRERDQELQFIFDNLPIGIWYKDDKNNVLRLNQSAAKSLDKSVSEVEGKNLSVFCFKQARYEWEQDKYIIESGQPMLNIIEKQVVGERKNWIRTDKVLYQSNERDQQRILVLKQDITELKQIEERLKESERRFQLVIEATYDGIWDWPDITKDEEYWSPQWKALLGYEENEIKASAKTFFSMLHPDDIPLVEKAVKAHKEQGIPFDVEYRLRKKNGDYHWFQAKGILSTDEETDVQRMTGSISNIQQRKESEKKLHDYNEELKRSNAVLDEYAYAASHDLQSPLRGIDQIASWIIEDLEEGKTEEIVSNLKLMRSRVKRMEKLLKDLLTYSKVGRREEAMDLANTEEIVKDLFKLASPPEGFQLLIEGDLPTFTTLIAPFEQVIRNLIGNAIKHHDKPNGTISISCILLEHNQYQFCIKDDGPGIDKKYHELVFKMFKSLKSRDEVEASGIGLTLVSKIITTYNGSIRLESELGKGATFYFTWPINIDT